MTKTKNNDNNIRKIIFDYSIGTIIIFFGTMLLIEFIILLVQNLK